MGNFNVFDDATQLGRPKAVHGPLLTVIKCYMESVCIDVEYGYLL